MTIRTLVLLIVVVGSRVASGEAPAPGRAAFDLSWLLKPPATFAADDLQVEGVQSLYYEGVPYEGRPTRIFAYTGFPAVDPARPEQKVPAMVLIHGGGGTAFDRWVKVWTERGYAAIAMDLCGCVPVGTYGNWKRHEHGGATRFAAARPVDVSRGERRPAGAFTVAQRSSSGC
jgi:hypothetical protein